MYCIHSERHLYPDPDRQQHLGVRMSVFALTTYSIPEDLGRSGRIERSRTRGDIPTSSIAPVQNLKNPNAVRSPSRTPRVVRISNIMVVSVVDVPGDWVGRSQRCFVCVCVSFDLRLWGCEHPMIPVGPKKIVNLVAEGQKCEGAPSFWHWSLRTHARPLRTARVVEVLWISSAVSMQRGYVSCKPCRPVWREWPSQQNLRKLYQAR